MVSKLIEIEMNLQRLKKIQLKNWFQNVPKHTSWPGSCPTAPLTELRSVTFTSNDENRIVSIFFYSIKNFLITITYVLKNICAYSHALGIQTLENELLSGCSDSGSVSGGCFFDTLGSIDGTRRKDHYTNTFCSVCWVLKFLSFQALDIFQN